MLIKYKAATLLHLLIKRHSSELPHWTAVFKQMLGVILIQTLAQNTVLELITPEVINTKCLTQALTNKKFIRKQANRGAQCTNQQKHFVKPSFSVE